MVTRILLWDIDGTLLTTNRAGIFAWEGAIAEVIGRPCDLADFRTAGLTDVEIAVKILDLYGIPPAPDQLNLLLRAYERLLPERLGWRQGRVMPGVRQVLEAFRGRDDLISVLLTGNLRACALAKLKHYNLDRYFNTGGGFADDCPDRLAVARRAVTLVQELLGSAFPTCQLYVIGDTPHDIVCGKAIGAFTIGVATGVYARKELMAHAPTWALDRLPDPVAFAQLLGLTDPVPTASPPYQQRPPAERGRA